MWEDYKYNRLGEWQQPQPPTGSAETWGDSVASPLMPEDPSKHLMVTQTNPA